MYVSRLLGLSPYLRAVELKQACYGATAALQLAKGHVALNPDKKALVIGSDIARYGLHTKGEPTQGGGACAMIVGQNPRILELEETSACYMEDVMDFWRPFNHTEALVNGKFSANIYVDFFKKFFRYTGKELVPNLKILPLCCFICRIRSKGLRDCVLPLKVRIPKSARSFRVNSSFQESTGDLSAICIRVRFI